MAARFRVWLFRPGPRSVVYFAFVIPVLITGLISQVYGAGLPYFLLTAACVFQCIRPHMLGWILVFVPSAMLTLVYGSAAFQELISFAQQVYGISPEGRWVLFMLAVFSMCAVFTAALWHVRPVLGASGEPDTRPT